MVQQHFCRNAADMQASAPQKRILFHDDRFQSQLTGSNCRNISAWTASDNRHIVLCHAESPFGWNPLPDLVAAAAPMRRLVLELAELCAVTRLFRSHPGGCRAAPPLP